MSHSGALIMVTLVALLAALPWLRVASAKDDAATLRSLRTAAICTVMAIGLLWAGWVLERAHALGLSTESSDASDRI